MNRKLFLGNLLAAIVAPGAIIKSISGKKELAIMKPHDCVPELKLWEISSLTAGSMIHIRDLIRTDNENDFITFKHS